MSAASDGPPENRERPLETAPPWGLSILGPFRLVRRDRRETAITGKKAMALLALLALAPGQSLRREQVMALLWSERGADQARSSLRQTLVVLRKETSADDPPPVTAEGDTLRLVGRLVKTDVAQFEQLARSEDDAEDLRQAAQLYRGELLEGLSVADDAFEEWLRGSRDRLREAAMVVLGKLARLGTAAQRIDAGRRLVALDPLREGSHGLLMQALAGSGDTASAIRQFEACKALLKAELGVEPSPELAALYKSLRARPEPVALEPVAGPARPSVAVLPFDNLDGDPAQRYFSDAVSEDIINGLSRFSSLFIVARHSSFRFRDQAGDVQAIARQLGVRYLVTGSVRRGGERIRIAAQLIDSADGRQMWSDRFERQIVDLFAVQDEVVQLIVSSLTGHLQNTEIRAALAKPTESLAAYDCLLRGIEFLRGYEPGVNRKAIEMFERAVELDPGYGLASGYLALALMVEFKWFNAPREVKERALALALTAARLAPGESRCQQFLGDAYTFSGSIDLGIIHYQKALALNPNDANGLTRLGVGLALAGRAEEGLSHARQAIRNNPFCPDYYWSDLALVAYAARHYEEALAATRRLIGHRHYWHLTRMAACLAQLGRLEEARTVAAEVLRLKPDFSLSRESLAYANPADEEHAKEGMRKAGLPE